jgi:hypothetical protein
MSIRRGRNIFLNSSLSPQWSVVTTIFFSDVQLEIEGLKRSEKGEVKR